MQTALLNDTLPIDGMLLRVTAEDVRVVDLIDDVVLGGTEYLCRTGHRSNLFRVLIGCRITEYDSHEMLVCREDISPTRQF